MTKKNEQSEVVALREKVERLERLMAQVWARFYEILCSSTKVISGCLDDG